MSSLYALGQACMALKRLRAEKRKRREKYKAMRMKRREQKRASRIDAREQQVLDVIDEQLSGVEIEDSDRMCPECGRPGILVRVDGIEIDSCTTCKGYWFDPGELASFSHKHDDVPDMSRGKRTSRFDCPICQVAMNEVLFMKPHNLLVDRCPEGHGVYLEEGELERVFEITHT
jgi:Zn-finger nucleic acid-binding protein